MFSSEVSCFLSVARTGSISDSASELYLTRQAVSKNIQEMESSLGLRLFHHTKSTMTLTVAGRMLYSFYTSSDYALSNVKRIYSQPPQNSLWLGWGGWMMPKNDLLDCVKDFALVHGVNLHVIHGQEHEMLEYLRTGEVDALLCSRYLSTFLREPCTVFHISEEPMLLGISASDPLANEDPARMVQHRTFLTCPAAEEEEEEIIGRDSRELLVFPRPAPRIEVFPNVQTVFLQVILGNGIAISPGANLYGYGIQTVSIPLTASLCLANLNRNTNPNLPLLREWIAQHYVPGVADNDTLDACGP